MHQAAVMRNLTSRRRVVDGCAKNARMLVTPRILATHLALAVAKHVLVEVTTWIIQWIYILYGRVQNANSKGKKNVTHPALDVVQRDLDTLTEKITLSKSILSGSVPNALVNR